MLDLSQSTELSAPHFLVSLFLVKNRKIRKRKITNFACVFETFGNDQFYSLRLKVWLFDLLFELFNFFV
jgi:hypothetical protein